MAAASASNINPGNRSFISDTLSVVIDAAGAIDWSVEEAITSYFESGGRAIVNKAG
jgi:hypothetical protein